MLIINDPLNANNTQKIDPAIKIAKIDPNKQTAVEDPTKRENITEPGKITPLLTLFTIEEERNKNCPDDDDIKCPDDCKEQDSSECQTGPSKDKEESKAQGGKSAKAKQAKVEEKFEYDECGNRRPLKKKKPPDVEYDECGNRKGAKKTEARKSTEDCLVARKDVTYDACGNRLSSKRGGGEQLEVGFARSSSAAERGKQKEDVKTIENICADQEEAICEVSVPICPPEVRLGRVKQEPPDPFVENRCRKHEVVPDPVPKGKKTPCPPRKREKSPDPPPPADIVKAYEKKKTDRSCAPDPCSTGGADFMGPCPVEEKPKPEVDLPRGSRTGAVCTQKPAKLKKDVCPKPEVVPEVVVAPIQPKKPERRKKVCPPPKPKKPPPDPEPIVCKTTTFDFDKHTDWVPVQIETKESIRNKQKICVEPKKKKGVKPDDKTKKDEAKTEKSPSPDAAAGAAGASADASSSQKPDKIDPRVCKDPAIMKLLTKKRKEQKVKKAKEAAEAKAKALLEGQKRRAEGEPEKISSKHPKRRAMEPCKMPKPKECKEKLEVKKAEDHQANMIKKMIDNICDAFGGGKKGGRGGGGCP